MADKDQNITILTDVEHCLKRSRFIYRVNINPKTRILDSRK
jgi:hypothetical protein